MTKVVTSQDINILSYYSTKSEAIRDLAAMKISRGQIAELLDIRYQHVRNVLTKPLKKVTQ